MNIHLILHDALYFFDIVLVVSVIILIAVKAKPGLAKIMLIVTWVCVIIFVISHALGVSVYDGELSRKILMFNMIDIFLPLSSAHSVFVLLGKSKQQMKVIVASYTIAIGLALFFIFNPNQFLLTSVPKMYFPNYYVPGQYYWLMLLFFGLLTVYFLFWMRKMYAISNGNEKNRIKYFMIALLLGYAVGSIDFLLIYNIQIDPLWGFLFVPLSVLPFTYAALEYDLMEISVVAKKALVYAVTTAFVGLFLIVLNYLNTSLIQTYPQFPSFASSTIFACITAIAVLVIWRKVREADILKDEFLNVVTHKFRTPLTSIKWTTENLRETAPESMKEEIQQIQTANDRLVELTNILVNLSGTDDKTYEYTVRETDIGEVLNGCVNSVFNRAKVMDIDISYVQQPSIKVMADEQKIKFIFQTLLENALTYSPFGGVVGVTVSIEEGRFSKKDVRIQFSDTGIGIPKDELKFIFTKFYRAKNGRKTDTEGMGIGLYLSRRIIERHKGKLLVESIGEGKGTVFTVIIPLL